MKTCPWCKQPVPEEVEEDYLGCCSERCRQLDLFAGDRDADEEERFSKRLSDGSRQLQDDFGELDDDDEVFEELDGPADEDPHEEESGENLPLASDHAQ